METENLIVRDFNLHHDLQDFQYISQKPYAKRFPFQVRELDRISQQHDPSTAIFSVDLKCPQGFVLAGPPSMVAIIIVKKNGLSFVSYEDMAAYQYEFEALGYMEKRLHGIHTGLDLEEMSDKQALSLLNEIVPP